MLHMILIKWTYPHHHLGKKILSLPSFSWWKIPNISLYMVAHLFTLFFFFFFLSKKGYGSRLVAHSFGSLNLDMHLCMSIWTTSKSKVQARESDASCLCLLTLFGVWTVTCERERKAHIMSLDTSKRWNLKITKRQSTIPYLQWSINYNFFFFFLFLLRPINYNLKIKTQRSKTPSPLSHLLLFLGHTLTHLCRLGRCHQLTCHPPTLQ